eukprot:XP_011668508.1 PREDICTED: regulator of nonsense transcripts 2 [Strongylocentrotus purpuratus]
MSDKTAQATRCAPIPIPVPRDSKEISVEKDKDIKPADESEKEENTAVVDKPCKSEGELEIKVSAKQDAGTKANKDEKKSSTSDTHSAKENKQSTDKPKKPEKMPSGQDHLESDLPNKERGGKSYSAQRSGSRVVGKKVEEEPKKFGRGSVEVRASDGKGGYDERKGGQTGQRRGKEIDVRNEKGIQRTRDRDRERDRERDKPRGDPYKDKTSERRRENDSRGSRRREEDKSRGREERMKEDEEKRKKEEEARKIQEEKKKEEDKIKQEEEKKRQAEEQKRLDVEAAKKKEEDDEKHARDTHVEALERKQAKKTLRAKNLAAASERPDEDFFVKLDSSLKKNTAFIRKLKTLSEQQKDSLTKEFQGLNLTKYVGEAAIAFSEAKMKMADIGCAVHLCSLFLNRYGDFSSQLLQGLQRALPAPCKKEDKDSKQQIIFDNKIRVELRFLAELIVNGVFTEKEGLPLLNNQLSAIMKGDKENHNYISIIISFTKHCGEDFAGIIPRKHKLVAQKYELELVSSEVFSTQLKTAYCNLLKDHYSSLSKYLERQHKELQNMERQNRRTLQAASGDYRGRPARCKKRTRIRKQQIIFDNKIRVELRFLAELIVNGVFTEKEGLPLLNNQLSAIMKGDKENHNYISIIISFTKHCGEDFAGIIPRKHKLVAQKYELELVSSEVFSTQLKTAYCNLLKDHYSSLSKYLERQHKELQNMERQNRRTLQNKGELSEERRKRHEEKQSSYQKLLMNTSTFADLLDEDMPDLPVEELTQTELDLMAIDMMGTDGQLTEFDWANSLWEDDDTRTFHENLINLRSMVPAILFKDTDNTSNQRPGDKEEDKLDKLEDDIKALEIEADEEEEAAIEEGEEAAEGAEGEEETVEEDTEGKAGEEMVLDEIETAEGDDGKLHIPAAVDFCLNLNTKSNRKKLSKALFNVPRVRLDLLPFYSRLVATLYVCMPDIATDLAERLKGEFRWHVRKKDQMMVESKIKVSRFIGELTKFKMCSKADTLQCLKLTQTELDLMAIDMMGTDGQLTEFDWANSLWEDDDTRTFHENLINLRSMVPAVSRKIDR